MRHRSNDLFSCPGTFETKSLGSRQISGKGPGGKGSIRNLLRNRNRESHFLSLQELKRLSRHHLSHDETLQWARHQAIGENDKLIKNSCHDALFAAQHCENTGRRDGERFHHQHAQRCCVPLPSDGPERCRSRARRQDSYRNIEWLEFGVQRFAEEEHVTFAGGVSSSSVRRAANTRFALRSAKSLANSTPKPLDAPVTRAHFPLTLSINFPHGLFVRRSRLSPCYSLLDSITTERAAGRSQGHQR